MFDLNMCSRRELTEVGQGNNCIIYLEGQKVQMYFLKIVYMTIIKGTQR